MSLRISSTFGLPVLQQPGGGFRRLARDPATGAAGVVQRYLIPLTLLKRPAP
jgi:hypothetical protein